MELYHSALIEHRETAARYYLTRHFVIAGRIKASILEKKARIAIIDVLLIPILIREGAISSAVTVPGICAARDSAAVISGNAMGAGHCDRPVANVHDYIGTSSRTDRALRRPWGESTKPVPTVLPLIVCLDFGTRAFDNDAKSRRKIAPATSSIPHFAKIQLGAIHPIE